MTQLKTIQTLIDKQDGFEVVRDQIAGILVCEVDNQMALATLAGKDPDLWKMRVFLERDNPFTEWLNIDSVKANLDQSPIVNIWYENGSFPMDKGNTVKRQMHQAVYNIDIYGLGYSQSDGGTGQIAGDKQAGLEAQRGVKLVRNILMAAVNTYLQLRGTVWRRWIQSITLFQPQISQQTVQQIVGARIAFGVEFNELAPQIDGQDLCEIGVKINLDESGQVFFEADYDLT